MRIPSGLEIIIYVYCDAEKLVQEYLSTQALTSLKVLSEFWRGFNENHELTVFQDIGGSEALYLRGKDRHLKPMLWPDS